MTFCTRDRQTTILVLFVARVENCHQVLVHGFILVHTINLKEIVLTKLLLQEACSATHLKLAFGDHSDPIGKEFSLVHIVGGQDDDFILLGLLD